MKYNNEEILEFLIESNAIEQEYSDQALEDAKKAWSYINEKEFMTPEVILAAHNFSARNVYPEIAGKWRNCDVWIGGKCKKFISIQLIEDDIKEFCLSLGSNKGKDLERKTRGSHIRFEHIHPFIDFNGRVGRLIYQWHRMKLGLPIHIIHADWPKKDGEQRSYYSWFRNTKCECGSHLFRYEGSLYCERCDK